MRHCSYGISHFAAGFVWSIRVGSGCRSLLRTFREWVRRTLPKIRVAMSNLECVRIFSSSGLKQSVESFAYFSTFQDQLLSRTSKSVRNKQIGTTELNESRCFFTQLCFMCTDQGRGKMHIVIKLPRSISSGWLTCCICQEVIAWPYPLRHLECC